MKKLYLFDADGTLRGCTVPGQPCPNRPGEWKLLPGVRDRLRELDAAGARFGVVSNQGGIGLGFLVHDDVVAMLRDMVDEILDPERALLVQVEICPHVAEQRCGCRKPNPRLLHKIMRHLDISAEETVFIGDQSSDRRAAEYAGCEFVWADQFFGWPAPAVRL